MNERVNPFVDKAMNGNLIDNWYFGSPVNQRGQATYTGMGYTIDRYFCESGTVSVVDGGVKFAGGTVVQKAEQRVYDAVKDHTLTLSALTADGQLFTQTAKFGGHSIFVSSGCELRTLTAQYQTFRISTNATGVTLLAVKLEIGNQQTLAHQENGVWVLNEIPDFGAELSKCQRYYWKNTKSDGAFHPSCLIPKPGAVYWSAASCLFIFLNQNPVTMRVTPTVKINGRAKGEQATLRDTYTNTIFTGTVNYGKFSLTLDGLISFALENVTLSNSGDISNYSGNMFEATIELSADL